MRSQRLRVCVTSVVEWLRAGYPDEAPRTGPARVPGLVPAK